MNIPASIRGILASMTAIMLCAGHASAEPWSLDSCINHAIKNNLSIKLNEVNVESSRLAIDQAKSGYLPTVSANAGQSWNLGRGLTAQNTYANRSTSSFNWGASANINIFDGMATSRRITYAKANLSQILERYEAAKEDVSINVIAAYLQVLYNKELHEVAVNQTALSLDEIRRREALLAAGKIPEIDLLEAKSQLSSDRLNEVQAQNNYTMSLIDLARLLRLDNIDGFDVTPLTEEPSIITETETAYGLAKTYSHNISAATKGIEAADANISLAKTGYMPKLSFGTSIGSTYYHISGMNNEKFDRQMKNNYSTYLGFQLNIPIFDAFSTRNSIRQAKVEKIQAELQLQQAEEELYRTINEVYYQAVGAYNKYQSSLEAEKYAIAAFDAMREKYNVGRATPTEYEQSNTKALQATAERIQANYELILRTRILNYYTTPH